MMKRLTDALDRIHRARGTHRNSLAFAASLHEKFDPFLKLALHDRLWPHTVTNSDTFTAVEVQLNLIDAAVILSAECLSQAEHAYRNALQLIVEDGLLRQLGSQIQPLSPEIETAITELGLRIDEVARVVELIADYDAALHLMV